MGKLGLVWIHLNWSKSFFKWMKSIDDDTKLLTVGLHGSSWSHLGMVDSFAVAGFSDGGGNVDRFGCIDGFGLNKVVGEEVGGSVGVGSRKTRGQKGVFEICLWQLPIKRSWHLCTSYNAK